MAVLFFRRVKTRKGAILVMIIITVFFIALGFVLYSQWSQDTQALQEKGRQNFTALSQNQLKDGMFVQGTVDSALAMYAQSYQTTLGIQNDKSLKQSYLVPIYGSGDEIQYFITFIADKDDIPDMDAIVARNIQEAPGSAELNLTNGRIYILSEDQQSMLDQWLQAKGDNGESIIQWCAENNIFGTNDINAIKSRFVPFAVQRDDSWTTNSKWLLYVPFLIAALCIAFLVYLISCKKAIKGLEPAGRNRKSWDGDSTDTPQSETRNQRQSRYVVFDREKEPQQELKEERHSRHNFNSDYSPEKITRQFRNNTAEVKKTQTDPAPDELYGSRLERNRRKK